MHDDDQRHLDDERIQRLLDDELSPALRAVAESHLRTCAACRAHLDAARAEDAWLADRFLELDAPAIALHSASQANADVTRPRPMTHRPLRDRANLPLRSRSGVGSARRLERLLSSWSRPWPTPCPARRYRAGSTTSSGADASARPRCAAHRIDASLSSFRGTTEPDAPDRRHVGEARRRIHCPIRVAPSIRGPLGLLPRRRRRRGEGRA
ncbi:MAG: zf-HC2 domain-containing protein [Candidatus Eisenbacteria bacterium]|nr:zf-HC2 domain-containing protein [Candidatus Eisenbacteria bacterium]